jgi:hypothetical protein
MLNAPIMMMMKTIIHKLFNKSVRSAQTRFTAFSLYTFKYLPELIRLRCCLKNIDAVMHLSTSFNPSIESS